MSISIRTSQQVTREIKALERCKTYVPHRTQFGADNWAGIDEQIGALANRLSVDTIYSAPYADEGNEDAYNPDILDAALQAALWLYGERDEAPSTDWDSYKPAKGEVTK